MAVAAPSLIDPYFYLIHWISMGRTESALDQFADDAVVIAGPACTVARPCVGVSAIREGYFPALAACQIPLPLTDQRFDGERLSTHGDTVVGSTCRGSSTRLRGGHTIEFRSGKIALLRFDPDGRGPHAAAWLARRASGATAPGR